MSKYVTVEYVLTDDGMYVTIGCHKGRFMVAEGRPITFQELDPPFESILGEEMTELVAEGPLQALLDIITQMDKWGFPTGDSLPEELLREILSWAAASWNN